MNASSSFGDCANHCWGGVVGGYNRPLISVVKSMPAKPWVREGKRRCLAMLLLLFGQMGITHANGVRSLA